VYHLGISSSPSPFADSAPNPAAEPTPNSFRSYIAPAIGRGSPPAFGATGAGRTTKRKLPVQSGAPIAEKGGHIMAWNMTAQMIETCSCNMLCPCWYGVKELMVMDRGWCASAILFRVYG